MEHGAWNLQQEVATVEDVEDDMSEQSWTAWLYFAPADRKWNTVHLNVRSFQAALQRLSEPSTRPLAVSDLTLYMDELEVAIPTADDWKQFWTFLPASLQRLDMQKFSMEDDIISVTWTRAAASIEIGNLRPDEIDQWLALLPSALQTVMISNAMVDGWERQWPIALHERVAQGGQLRQLQLGEWHPFRVYTESNDTLSTLSTQTLETLLLASPHLQSLEYGNEEWCVSKWPKELPGNLRRLRFAMAPSSFVHASELLTLRNLHVLGLQNTYNGLRQGAEPLLNRQTLTTLCGLPLYYPRHFILFLFAGGQNPNLTHLHLNIRRTQLQSTSEEHKSPLALVQLPQLQELTLVMASDSILLAEWTATIDACPKLTAFALGFQFKPSSENKQRVCRDPEIREVLKAYHAKRPSLTLSAFSTTMWDEKTESSYVNILLFGLGTEMATVSLIGRLRKDTGPSVAGAHNAHFAESSIEPAIPTNTSSGEYEWRRQARKMAESGSPDAQARFVRDLESKSSK
jgi:hypothetical protein